MSFYLFGSCKPAKNFNYPFWELMRPHVTVFANRSSLQKEKWWVCALLMPFDVMTNAELALLHLWASSLSLLRVGQRKTNFVSCIKRWNSVCRSDEENGLAHLKPWWGTGLAVFLGPYVSDRSTAEDVEDAGWFEPAGHLFTLRIGQKGRRDMKSWRVAMNLWRINQKPSTD